MTAPLRRLARAACALLALAGVVPAQISAQALPTVSVAARTTPVSEGAPAAEFVVTRTGDGAAPLRVRFVVSETGDMVAAGDEGAGSRTIPAGLGSAVIPVPTVDDGRHEADSVVTMALAADPAYALGSDASAGVTVEDDDPAPVVTVTAVTSAVVEGADAEFTVTRTVVTSGALTVRYDVIETGAMVRPGETGAKTVGFSGNAASVTVTVPTVGDSRHEGNSRVTVALTADAAYEVGGDATARVLVRDDDDSPATGAVTVSGTAREGETLTADASSITDEDGGLDRRAYVYQWVRTPAGGADADVSGATQDTYVPVLADAGATLKVRVTVTDGEGHVATFTSAPTAAVEALPRPTVTVAAVSGSVEEGEDVELTVTRAGVTSGALTVRYDVSESADMVVAGDEGAKSVDFSGDAASVTVTVPTADDGAHEADSVVTVALAADAAYDLGSDATAAVTVEDDDNAAPTGAPVIDDTTPVVGETLTADASGIGDPDGLTGAVFAWQWSRVSGGTRTRISGATARSYTVVDGDVGARLVVEARFTDDDGVAETVESAETAAAEAQPVLSIGDARVDEGDTGSVTLDFTVALDRAAAAAAVSVDWATSDGSARAGEDYTAGSGTVTFNAGDVRRTVTVTVAGDTVDEPNETLAVTLSGASGAEIGDGVATGTITDDDASPSVTLRLSVDSIGEAGGQSVVTATLSHASRDETTVTVSAAPVAPAVAGDYGLSSNRTLTIAAGATSSTGVVTVTAVDNSVDAPHKAVTVSATASNTLGVTGPADVTLAITDDDATPSVTLRLSSDSIGEAGGQSTVTATLSHASSDETTVTVSAAPVAPATAGDYVLSASRTLTIAAGATSSTGVVTVTAVDNPVDAPHKTVTVSATAANAQGVTGPEDVALSITDDEDAPSVTLRLSSDSIGEAGGTATVTAVLAHPSSDETAVTVSASPAGGYVLSANVELTIAAGAMASTGVVTVTGVDDDVASGTRQVTVSGAASNAQGVTGPADVVLSIADDDAPGLSIADASAEEGDVGDTPVTFAVVLAPVALSQVTVDWATADGTAVAGTDYAAASGRLTFGAGDSRRTVTVMVTGDGVDEPDRTFSVRLTNAAGAAVSDGAATGTIRDDDDTPVVTLVLTPDSITEDGAAAEVTAMLDRPSSDETTVSVSAAPVAPAVAGDYALGARTVLTIAAGRTMSARTVTITGVDNDVDAPHKRVTVSGAASNAQGVTGPADVTLAIRDDDGAPEVTLRLTPSTIAEGGGTSAVTASLSHASSAVTTVTVSAAPAGGYALDGRLLTIAAGATASTGAVTVTALDDDVVSSDRVVTVSGAAVNRQGVTGPADVTLTIAEDDELALALGVSPAAVSEGGGPVTVTVTATVLGVTLGEARTVAVTVAGSGDAAAVDFAAVAPFDIEVPAGPPGTAATGTFVLVPEDDVVDEVEETLRVSGRARGVAVTAASLALGDDDEAPSGITLGVAPAQVSEGDGETPVTVTATVAGGTRFAAERSVAVTVSGSGDDAAVDFAQVGELRVTVPAGEQSGEGVFVLAPEDDATDELDETVTVGGCLLGDGGCVQGFAVTGAQVRLSDDDGVSLSVADVVVREDAGQAVFTLRLSRPSERAVEVAATFADGTARRAVDYRPGDERVVLGPGETQGTLRVGLVDNEAMGGSRSFEQQFDLPAKPIHLSDRLGSVSAARQIGDQKTILALRAVPNWQSTAPATPALLCPRPRRSR